ncbi:MAG: hypothetical protein H7239_00135 [Flavobacterium sp.]|nr:hypothetical protein [Flavobacterium sp.]
MKTLFGIGLIILGLVSLFRYPNLGRDGAETFGAVIGFAIIIDPGILLVRSDNKKKQ